MKLSKHFHLDEFLVSETARRKGLSLGIPPQGIIARLQFLVDNCLEPLRLEVKRPIVITSGWRPDWLNKMVGGSASSQHMHGEAVDFIIPGLTTHEVCIKMMELDLQGKLQFDQLIHEFPPQGWVHVSCSQHQRRGTVLTAVKQNKRTIYLKGLYNG